MNRTLIVLALLAVPACDFLTAQGDLERDPRWVMLQEEVQDRTLEVQALVGEIDILTEELKEEGITADFAAQAGRRLAEAIEQVALLTDLQEKAAVDLEAISAEYEVPEWQLWLASAASAVVGMGVPTSGPLAGILAGLGPVLESLGVRNRRKRREYHTRRDADQPLEQ